MNSFHDYLNITIQTAISLQNRPLVALQMDLYRLSRGRQGHG